MKKYKVAILGATGAVGREMMKVLAERDFPVAELHLLASQRSMGQAVHWRGHDIPVELACDEAFEGMDIVLGAAENDIAERFAPPSSRREPCSWTTPARFVWTPACRWSFRRSTRRT